MTADKVRSSSPSAGAGLAGFTSVREGDERKLSPGFG